MQGSSYTFREGLSVTDRGIPIFPTVDKKPAVTGGFYAASTDPERVERWAETWPGAGIGMPTGIATGVVVADADGPEQVEKLTEAFGRGPDVRTFRGGHWYFKHPKRGKVTSGPIAPGVDRKGDGGYVEIPPTPGKVGDVPDFEKLPVLPRRFAKAPLMSRSGGPAGGVDGGEPIPEGLRNDTLFRRGCFLWGRGYSSAEVEEDLQQTNIAHCSPPLEADEVSRIAESACRYPDGGFHKTDIGNAQRLVFHFGQNVRYCYEWGAWLIWTGKRWEKDAGGGIERHAKETVRRIYGEAADAGDPDERRALSKHAMRSEAGNRIRAMINLARSEPGIPVRAEDLDADPYAFNTNSGTVDLRTGGLRPHDRRSLITRIAPVEYDPRAEAPEWARFLDRIMSGNGALIRFLQRALGYSLTGDVSERALFIPHGDGKNGKSTLVETAHAAMGDYAMRTPTETLLEKRYGGVPNDVARLKGQRFVTASETGRGHKLAESTVKELAGNDTISARFMRAEWFDFKPTHKIWLSTNYRPEVKGDDSAIWDRIKLIPFDVRIPESEQDRELPGKLRRELPGILAWMVRGCVEWYGNGLQEPDEVRAATAGYRAEMDPLKYFLEDHCETGPDFHTPVAELHESYVEWAREHGEERMGRADFGKRMTARFGESKAVRVYGKPKRCYPGVRLKQKPSVSVEIGHDVA